MLLCLTALSALAQITKVRGRVTDEQGEPVPFAAVFFENTTNGITADMDGVYSLEMRDLSVTRLVCQILGYDTVVKEITPGKFSTVDFVLHLTDNELAGAHVKADNKRAGALLAGINANRARNDPDSHEKYIVRVYNKLEVDLTHPEEQLRWNFIGKKMDFLFDYTDTSSVSGVPYLPVLLSETVSEHHHTSNPDETTEKIEANNVSGVNPDNNLVSQFTGSMHMKLNFYQDFVNVFGLECPSPIQQNALLYYNYYIIDSLQVDGRKTLLVRYHPKKFISTPTFDGEMRIDAEDFALRSIHANMRNMVNVNWMRDFVADAEYQRLPSSGWFYKSDGFYVDLSLAERDSSRVFSFIGKRETSYGEPDLESTPDVSFTDARVQVAKDAGHKDADYWEAERPEPLTEKEKGVYEMVDRVKEQRTYKVLYSVVKTLSLGYYESGNFAVGPFYKMASFNHIEGFRPQVGIRTSNAFSTTDRVMGFVAYGTEDRTLKYGGSWEHMFSREPTRKLTIDGRYDYSQIGTANSTLSSGNVFISLLGGSKSNRSGLMRRVRVIYDHEFSPSFNFTTKFEFKRHFSNLVSVPMYSPADSSRIGSVSTTELHLVGRFSKDEVVNRGYFKKNYLNSLYPIVTVDLCGAVPGLWQDSYGYFRPEVSVNWKVHTPPFGLSRFYLEFGTIMGQVPYPFLHVHEGNSTYLANPQAFSCMDYFEFASDTWATFFWNHSFNGYFLGKIPLVRELGLREEFTFRATWGRLSDKNNGDLVAVKNGEIPVITAPMLFPNGMHSMGRVPYAEVGVGLSNILKVLRVDCFWRLTHRESEVVDRGGHDDGPATSIKDVYTRYVRTKNFTVNVGAEFRF